MTTIPLIIYDSLEAIQCAQAILDFTLLFKYVIYDEEMLCYIEHALYWLEKTKIVFEQHWPIEFKLC